jgi:hypothetical protein
MYATDKQLIHKLSTICTITPIKLSDSMIALAKHLRSRSSLNGSMTDLDPNNFTWQTFINNK